MYTNTVYITVTNQYLRRLTLYSSARSIELMVLIHSHTFIFSISHSTGTFFVTVILDLSVCFVDKGFRLYITINALLFVVWLVCELQMNLFTFNRCLH